MKSLKAEKKRLKEEMKQEQLKSGIIPKKPFYKKWWFIALVIIVVIGAAVGGTTTPQDTTNSTQQTTQDTDTTNYKTELEWALDSNYMIKVEDSSFDGDVIKAGKYRFYPNNVSSFEKGEMIKEGTPIVWDIYISKNEYKK